MDAYKSRQFDVTTDWLVLLLSTDWFFEYWRLLGADLPDAEKLVIQQKCRKVAMQIMADAAGKDYYSTIFSQERLERTRQLCKEAVGNEHLFEQLKRQFATVDTDEGSAWLLQMVTEDIINDNLYTSLDPATVEFIRNVWSKSDVDSEELHDRCLESSSEWDLYTKSLTPGLPSRLADFLTEEVGVAYFDVFWLRLRKFLSADQKSVLIDYYRHAILQMSGQDVDLSKLH